MAAQTTSHSNLYGSCACERNQYAIAIPQSHAQEQSTSQAHVFFDSSRANRRSQAAPLTAWLRIPLAWYHSNTQAYYPDESHASIRRTFYTPASLAEGKEVRKQFCGYCGTHLNACREGESSDGQWMDVTLGSLWGESLSLLEGLGWLDFESESEEEEQGGRDVVRAEQSGVRNRGTPWFEQMVEDSRLGRIKRQRGGQESADGSSRVEWEVTEIEGGDDDTVMDEVVEQDADVEGGHEKKRLKLGD